MKKLLCLALALILTLSFTALASETADTAFFCKKTSIDGLSVVWAEINTISIEFSQDVDTCDVTIKKNGEDVSAGYSAEINSGNAKIVDVVFTNDNDGAEYVIDFSGCKAAGDVGIAEGGKTSVTFKVEAAPEVEVTSIESLTGIDSAEISTTPVNEETTFLADDGSVQGWIVNFKNNLDEAKAVTVFCGIYDENGKLCKVVTSGKTIAAEAEDSIGFGTIIPETTDTGVNVYDRKAKVKLFIWNNETARSPYVEAISFDIIGNK